ncbi:cell division cycle-associated protein 2 isoform X2 [Neoarius graeffei]|uniref:cell division cycle-associated protein 2 isoform X2 n=1 Tax=Neoarius graeffei TaxID=443677 RepID=UPI00298CE0F6|nr:cell division cycle-associated protein 2 isoform X2 [Neoarius graeffei]
MESEAGMENRTPLGPLIPSQQNGESGTLDFSKLTPGQFGITPNSFTAFRSDKDKSRVAQLKARRRSTIGLRGSPETNSLICFRARQVVKMPPRTPQHLLESPLFSGCDSIKQKMAAFQRLMGTDEENTEHSASLMEEEGVRHAQSGGDGGSEERENRLGPGTPPLSKSRRRRGTPPQGLRAEQIEEEPLSKLSLTPKHEQQVEFKGPKMARGLDSGSSSQSQLMCLPMLSKPELIKTGDGEVTSVSKKKRVRFGAPLSPEFFDKTLPPSTPLQKGATPIQPPSSAGRKHSLLKTPQGFELPLPQPDFSSPGGCGASPVRMTHTYSDGGGDGDDVFLDNLKISLPIMDEEYDNPPADRKDSSEPAELTAHPEPLPEDAEIMDATLQEDEETQLCFTAPPDHPTRPPAEPELQTEQEEQPEPLKPAEPCAEAPRPRGRKRKQPAESKPTETRRSSRSAAESAKGKMKTSSAKKRFGTKDVDRSLYGERGYASKNPLLSPIIESALSSLSSTPVQPLTSEITPVTDENPDSGSAPSLSTNADARADLVAAAALWRRHFLRQDKDGDLDTNLTVGKERSVLMDAPVQSEASVESSAATADKRAGRAARGRRNSASRRRSWNECEGGDQKADVHQSECHESNQDENPAGGQVVSRSAERKSGRKTPSRGRQRERKSPRTKNSSVAEEEEHGEERRGLEKTCQDMVESSGSEKEVVEDMRQTSGHEVEEKKNNENSNLSSSFHGENLEPWQQPDFCIEDVLKRERGSVRRSLRHRRSMDVLAKGLAWVEHTSPQMIATNPRRRTRGRLSGVSQCPLFTDSEETLTEQ